MQIGWDQNVPYILLNGHILGHQEVGTKCRTEGTPKNWKIQMQQQLIGDK